MALNWDLFGDETKVGGNVTAVGILALEVGVVSNLIAVLVQERDRVLNAHGGGMREVHWVDLDAVERQIADAWIRAYLRSPMAFFVYAPATSTGGSRFDLIRRAVERLEADPRVPGGLIRDQTTAHLDYDAFDIRQLWRLRRQFGLLRAFPWDSHGSPLLQLSDVLLGVSHCLYTGQMPHNTGRGKHKLQLIAGAQLHATAARKNIVFAYERTGMRQLLP